MKKHLIKIALCSLIAFGGLSSCSKSSSSSSKNISRATGWKINAKEGGFEYNSEFKEQETPPGTVFIEEVHLLKVRYRMM